MTAWTPCSTVVLPAGVDWVSVTSGASTVARAEKSPLWKPSLIVCTYCAIRSSLLAVWAATCDTAGRTPAAQHSTTTAQAASSVFTAGRLRGVAPLDGGPPYRGVVVSLVLIRWCIRRSFPLPGRLLRRRR